MKNTLKKNMTRGLTTLAVSAAVLGVGAPTAWAADVSGIDYYGNGAIEASANVGVLSVDDLGEDTLYLKVTRGGTVIGDRIAYSKTQNSTGATAGDDSQSSVVSLSINSLKLDGSATYTVTAYSDRAETHPLYTGAIYGVYARLDGDASTDALIGVHTGVDAGTLNYKPAAQLYLNSKSYALDSPESQLDGQAKTKIVYSYSSYDESAAADGSISYVDVNGAEISTETVAGVTAEGKTYTVPSVVTKEIDGVTYFFRTVTSKNVLKFENPGQLSYTITCKQMGSSIDGAAGNLYKATIKMVDQDGNQIATDTVNVTGTYNYTLPGFLYKKASTQIYAYTLNDGQSQTLSFNAATDGVTSGAKTITVKYARSADTETEGTVTFNLIDGSKAAGEAGRNLGTTTKKVSLTNKTAAPEEGVTVNGAKYVIAGTASKYAYTLGSNSYPVVNVYYVPEGYSTHQEPYTVTVNYVNFLTGKTIKSESFESSEDETEDHKFESSEKFSQDGVDYVRLDGQEEPILHNFYSGIKTYTVYYRDVNDTYTSGTVINTIRVVYVDGTEGTVIATNNGTVNNGTAVTDNGTVDNGTTSSTTTGTATTGNAANEVNGINADGSATTAGQLNVDGTYNVLDGTGNNATLTNEAGEDSNSERIDDNETPLARAVSGLQQNGWAVPAGIGAALAACLGGLLIFFKKRKNNDDEQQEA